MIDQDPKIKKAMPAKREGECLRVVTDIVIPRGTLLRREGTTGVFSCPVEAGEFSVAAKPGETPVGFRRVAAS